MFLGSPHCFVIVKNLKRNHRDKISPWPIKASFTLWLRRQLASEGPCDYLHLCVSTSDPLILPEAVIAQKVASGL